MHKNHVPTTVPTILETPSQAQAAGSSACGISHIASVKRKVLVTSAEGLQYDTGDASEERQKCIVKRECSRISG